MAFLDGTPIRSIIGNRDVHLDWLGCYILGKNDDVVCTRRKELLGPWAFLELKHVKFGVGHIQVIQSSQLASIDQTRRRNVAMPAYFCHLTVQLVRLESPTLPNEESTD